MAWGLVQTVDPHASAGGASLTIAFGSNVAAGNRILVNAGSHDDTQGTMHDHVITHTGTATVDSWTSIVGPIDETTTPVRRGRIWTAYVTGTGSKSVVCQGRGTP